MITLDPLPDESLEAFLERALTKAKLTQTTVSARYQDTMVIVTPTMTGPEVAAAWREAHDEDEPD